MSPIYTSKERSTSAIYAVANIYGQYIMQPFHDVLTSINI